MILTVSLLTFVIALLWNKHTRCADDHVGLIILWAISGLSIIAWLICGFICIANLNYESINQKNVDLAENRYRELTEQVLDTQAESVSTEISIYAKYRPIFSVSYPDVKTPNMVQQSLEKLIKLRKERDAAIVEYARWATVQNALFDMTIPWAVCL
jgi:hypothetical protein